MVVIKKTYFGNILEICVSISNVGVVCYTTPTFEQVL